MPVPFGFHFTPLETFEAPEVRSTYVEGLGYTVNPGNTLLAGLVEKWLAEGKVAPRATTARMIGG